MRRYGEAIAALHPPGVVIDLTYYSAALDLINAISDADQAIYLRELTRMAAGFSGPGVTIRVVDLVVLHGGRQRFRTDFEHALERTQVAVTAAQRASAARNLAGAPTPDLIEQSARACVIMQGLPERLAYNKTGHRIQRAHIRGPSLVLHLGSTRASTHQPWVGQGYLARTRTKGWVEAIARDPRGVRSVAVRSWVPGLETIPVQLY